LVALVPSSLPAAVVIHPPLSVEIFLLTMLENPCYRIAIKRFYIISAFPSIFFNLRWHIAP
jgi:hypothetical protein